MDAAGDRRHRVAERQPRHRARSDEPLQREMERDIAAGDRGGARAAIGLQHVAVDADLALAQQRRDR